MTLKAKAKAPAAKAKAVASGARIDKCAWCGEKRQGWSDPKLVFYCEHCWTDYDTLHGAGGEDYAGRVWHDEILEEDNIAAEDEDDDDGQNVLEFTKNALDQIASDKKATPKKDAADDSDDEHEEHGDELKPLSMAFGKSKQPEFELQQAHVVVVVDTSGSMRTNDVKQEADQKYITRMAAVMLSLSSFFEKQMQSGCPHQFSLISFSEASRVHFIAKTATQARNLATSQASSFVPGRGTHFVEGLTGAQNILRKSPGTPHLLIFSDGRPADGVRMIQAAQKMLHEFPTLRIHAIGFGDGLDFDFLQQLASIGRGTFAPAARSVTALKSAFASVTSTITATQTVTSSSRMSSTYSFQGGQAPSSGEDALDKSRKKELTLRNVSFEPANQFVWNTNASASFKARRRWFRFNGKDFKMEERFTDYKHNPVSIRLQPFTQGGMRLVYCFRDSTIPFFVQQGLDKFARRDWGTHARMVAKVSRYTDDWHNSSDIVSAHAKSSAVARFYSRVFRLAVVERLGWEGRKMTRILFVECYVYKAEGGDAPAPFFVGERFLPGSFRKYNSNHGYVDPDVPDSEIAQAFSHFTFQASRGKHMVLDLQGVHVDNTQRRKPHLIFTDPQVVSLEKSFGPGDLGDEGMRAFFRSHRCGITCKKLGLDQDAWKNVNRRARQELSESSTSTAGSSSNVPATRGAATVPPTSGSISDLRAADPQPGPLSSLGEQPAEPSAPKLGTNKAFPLTLEPRADPVVAEACLGELEKGDLGRRIWRVCEPGMEPLKSRHPPSFGAKADGPLSALMARSSGDSKPNYDMLLQRMPATDMQARCLAPAKSSAGNRPEEARVADAIEERLGIHSPKPPTSCQSAAEAPKPAQQQTRDAAVYGPGGKKLTLSASCRGHVVAAIAKEFSIPEEEQLLFQESSSQPNTDFYRVERKMDPRKLRFTQNSISPSFRGGQPIFDLLNDLNLQKVDPLRELEPLDVVWHNGFWRSLSNRRLWALKHCTLAFSEQPLFVRVRVRAPDAEFHSKFTSTNDGASVLIAQRPRSPSPSAARMAA